MEPQTKRAGFTSTLKAIPGNPYEQSWQDKLDELLQKMSSSTGKKSFLVFKQHKYITIPTEQIAFFISSMNRL